MINSKGNHAATQCTIGEAISYIGMGLHNGRMVSMDIHPAAPNTGICFVRKDVIPEQAVIQADWRNVVDTRLCTVIGNEHGVTVATVEHVLAALRGCRVDNAVIEINGSEVPILDGSCLPLVSTIQRVGIVSQRAPRLAICIERPIEVEQGERYAVLNPDVTSRITVEVEFEAAAIGAQRLSVELNNDAFETEVAAARTFGFAEDVEKLRSQGLARGGSLRNAVLVDGDRVVNEEGLRYPDEFARHKILDCLGDLALAGRPIVGHLYAYKPGHRLNNALLRQLFAQKDAWRLVTYEDILRREQEPLAPTATVPSRLDSPVEFSQSS